MRGPFAWLGYGYQGCADMADESGAFPNKPWSEKGYGDWDPLLVADYGEPQPGTQCHETEPGVSEVFVREYQKATVQLDCRSFEAEITFK